MVLAGSYPFLNKSSVSTSSEDTGASDQLAAVQEAENLLAKIQNVSLDFSILDRPEFTYLKDITTPILTLPVGRANPFAPIK